MPRLFHHSLTHSLTHSLKSTMDRCLLSESCRRATSKVHRRGRLEKKSKDQAEKDRERRGDTGSVRRKGGRKQGNVSVPRSLPPTLERSSRDGWGSRALTCAHIKLNQPSSETIKHSNDRERSSCQAGQTIGLFLFLPLGLFVYLSICLFACSAWHTSRKNGYFPLPV